MSQAPLQPPLGEPGGAIRDRVLDRWSKRLHSGGFHNQSTRCHGVYEVVPWGKPATPAFTLSWSCGTIHAGGVRLRLRLEHIAGGGELQASLGSVLSFGLRGGMSCDCVRELLVSRPTVLSNASRAEKRNRVGPSPNRGGLPGFSLGLGLDLTVCRPVYHGVYVAVAGGTLLGASRDGFAPNV